MLLGPCRVCWGRTLEPFLDLGPRRAALCRGCGLVQLYPAPPEADALRPADASADPEGLAAAVARRLDLGPEDLVLAAASGDGAALVPFRRRGVRVLGVEASPAAAERARRRGVDTVEDRFDAGLARALTRVHGPARVVLAGRTLERAADPHDVVRAVRAALTHDGLGVFETADPAALLRGARAGALAAAPCRYPAALLRTLLRRHGLKVIAFEEARRGSLRTVAAGEGSAWAVEASAEAVPLAEAGLELERVRTWRDAARRAAGVVRLRAA